MFFSISKSVETKSTGCALFFLARPASNASGVVSAALPAFLSARPFGAPVERLSAAGEGVFTNWCGGLQVLFLRNVIFFSYFLFFLYFQWLRG